MTDDTSTSATGAEVRRDGSRVEIVLRGDLDSATTPSLLTQIEPVLGGAAAVAVDCSAVAFCDSAGLSFLIHISNQVGDEVPVHIANPSPSLSRLLQITGSAELFAWGSTPTP